MKKIEKKLIKKSFKTKRKGVVVRVVILEEAIKGISELEGKILDLKNIVSDLERQLYNYDYYLDNN